MRIQRRAVIVPVKALKHAKTRLSGFMGDQERAALAAAMTRDVLEVLRQLNGIDVFVVGGCAFAESLATERRLTYFAETGTHAGDVNAAVGVAVGSLETAGYDAVAVVHADLPALQSALVDAVFESLQRVDVVVTPDEAGMGTNVLGWRLGSEFKTAYSNGSFSRHLKSAARLGLKAEVLRDPYAALDIDLPADLLKLHRWRRQLPTGETLRYIQQAGLPQRLVRVAMQSALDADGAAQEKALGRE